MQNWGRGDDTPRAAQKVEHTCIDMILGPLEFVTLYVDPGSRTPESACRIPGVLHNSLLVIPHKPSDRSPTLRAHVRGEEQGTTGTTSGERNHVMRTARTRVSCGFIAENVRSERFRLPPVLVEPF